jgi:hypothetical protein
MVSFSTLFEIFNINEEFHPYLDALTNAIHKFTPFQGCKTSVIINRNGYREPSCEEAGPFPTLPNTLFEPLLD